MTGKGTKRMARPARVIPRIHNTMPVAAVVSAMTMSVASSTSLWPPAAMRRISVATIAAMMTEMELSGPATAKNSELRDATTAPATAADRKVTDTPYERKCASGPVKMSAA